MLTIPRSVTGLPQLSPLRWPGGKVRWIPAVESLVGVPQLLIEPFAGGASVGLWAASRGARVILSDADDDLAAFWAAALDPAADLPGRIRRLGQVSRQVFDQVTTGPDRALSLLLRNRFNWGGNCSRQGYQITSTWGYAWYPETLARRIEALQQLPIEFHHAEAEEIIAAHADHPAAVWFVDPPYVVGTKAGSRLYTRGQVDTHALLQQLTGVAGRVIVTLNDHYLIREWAADLGYTIHAVSVTGTSRVAKPEVVLTYR